MACLKKTNNKLCAHEAGLCSNLINKLQPQATSAVVSLGQSC